MESTDNCAFETIGKVSATIIIVFFILFCFIKTLIAFLLIGGGIPCSYPSGHASRWDFDKMHLHIQ